VESSVAGVGIFNAPVEEVKKIMDEDPAVQAGGLICQVTSRLKPETCNYPHTGETFGTLTSTREILIAALMSALQQKPHCLHRKEVWD
jgi:hypothetical protein